MPTNTFARAATLVAGLFYLVVTLILFVAPAWFFKHVGQFPPFNRHYMGDLASFMLPLALGLLLAARDPVRYRWIIAMATLASVVHTVNHFYDAVFEQITHGHWLIDFTPLVLLAAALATAYYRAATSQAESLASGGSS